MKASGDNVSDVDDIDMFYHEDGTLESDKARQQNLATICTFVASRKVEAGVLRNKAIQEKNSRMRRP